MKKRNAQKKLKQVAIKEALKHKDEGSIEIVKAANGKYFIIRITKNTSKSGILIDRYKPPFNTWAWIYPKGEEQCK